MPEGPEIRRAADAISKAIGGREASTVWFAFDELTEFEDVLEGRCVEAVEPRGKAILTRFEGGWNIYSHNQLYGKWVICGADESPDNNRQLRVEVANEDKRALLYSASEIEVLRDDELSEQSYLAKLGPDPLAEDVTSEDIRARYEDDTFHRRQLATLLLDQGFVAGLGNYLRSEILWYAGVHPRNRISQLDADTRRILAEGTYELTRRAYENKGVTNDPERVESMKIDGVPWRVYRYYVFGRDGEYCYRCDSKIVREEHGGRRVYRCVECQEKR
jgi:endonuclease-8